MIIIKYNGISTVPGFVIYEATNHIVMCNPIRDLDYGSHIIDITLSDGSLTTSYQLQLTINQPAKFAEALLD